MKKLILLVIPILLLCGCQKCVESHQEFTRCARCHYIRVGRQRYCVRHYYTCRKTVCDKWEDD